jgi:DNA-binding MarR family transcriptional regulator
MSNRKRGKPPRLLDRISFLVHRINAHLMRHTNPLLKEWGIDLTESRLMVAILEMGPMAAGDLVRVMAIPQSTVSHQVKRLEKLGYVARNPAENDSRVVIMMLTERGTEIATQAEAYSRSVTEKIAEAVGGDAELEIVRAAMKRIDEVFARTT